MAAGIEARIQRAEAGLDDYYLWREVKKLAKETGREPAAIFLETKAILKRYSHLLEPGPGEKVDMAPALRAVAADEGLDYNELLAEAKRTLRRLRARKARMRQ